MQKYSFQFVGFALCVFGIACIGRQPNSGDSQRPGSNSIRYVELARGQQIAEIPDNALMRVQEDDTKGFSYHYYSSFRKVWIAAGRFTFLLSPIIRETLRTISVITIWRRGAW